MSRQLRIVLIVAGCFSLTLLAAVGESLFPLICSLVLFPGLAIVGYGLHVNFWRHPGGWLWLIIVFNTLTYSALFGIFFELPRFIQERRKSQR